MQRFLRYQKILICLLTCLWTVCLYGNQEVLILRDNLRKAQKNDFIVTSSNKNQTVLRICSQGNERLLLEEITVAESKKITQMYSWKDWIANGAPFHTSWIMYEIDLTDGQILRAYSFTKQGWLKIADGDNFLSKLLTLRFWKVPDEKRRRVGRGPRNESRPLWQPLMIVEGHQIDGVSFDAWKGQWPKDGGDLSGKIIEVYLPQESSSYPGYFPYWLEISGLVGKAKIRIIDSGHDMHSPKPCLISNERVK